MKDTTRIQLRSWLFALLALAALLGAGQVLPELNRQRQALKLTGTGRIADLPAWVVLANRAGGVFRALAINSLWMRATELQDKGEVFELVQLYEWITALEPRFPMVWAYRAWNAAYNISVKFPAILHRIFDLKDPRNQPDKRWEWVQRGIETLRDQGIPWNPNAERLYRELAWIYQHKIGQDMDDAHFYYKVRLAQDMQNLLGEPPYRATLEAICAAPKSRKEFLADEAVRSLVEKDLVPAGVDPFKSPFDVLIRSPHRPEPARTALQDPAKATAVAALEAFLRGVYLREKLKMEPESMLAMMERHGPIDWRLPDAHAFYWIQRANEVVPDEALRAANSQRIAFQALLDFYRRGRLSFRYDAEHPERTFWRTSPHFGFVQKTVEFYEGAVQGTKGTEQEDPLREGFLNFLRGVVFDLYVHNNVKRSREYYRKLQAFGPEAQVEYEDFINNRWTENLRNAPPEEYTSMIKGLLLQTLALASCEEMEEAAGRENLAKLIRDKYNATRQRSQIEPIEKLYPDVFQRALRVFEDWQIERLEQLYPERVKKAREELEKQRREPPVPPSPREEGGAPAPAS